MQRKVCVLQPYVLKEWHTGRNMCNDDLHCKKKNLDSCQNRIRMYVRWHVPIKGNANLDGMYSDIRVI